jgi:predicted small lipoprotein YifL
MRRLLASHTLLAILLGLTLAACGGGGESDAEKQAEAERSEAFAPICEMTAMSGETGLPADFPTISEITWVKSEKAGPSRIVEGYADGDLEDVYNKLHDEFESSNYKITFDEREEHDAEISFEGGGQSGQVKFAAECGQEGRLYVRVTSRPTG